MTLLSAFCFAFQIILIDKYTEDNDSVLIAITQIGFVTIPSLLCWGVSGFETFELSRTVIYILIITGVFGTALAFAGQTIVQKFTSPTRTAIILSAESLFGAIFALIIPDSNGMTEKLAVTSTIGCVLILTGMIISELKIGKAKKCIESEHL